MKQETYMCKKTKTKYTQMYTACTEMDIHIIIDMYAKTTTVLHTMGFKQPNHVWVIVIYWMYTCWCNA